MRVEEWMSRNVRCCAEQDTLETAAGSMWNHDIGTVVVVDREMKPVGMLTDRDICMAAYTQGRPLSAIEARVAMSRGVVTCRPSDELEAAGALLRQHQVRRLPVLGAGGEVVGVVSLNDLARAACSGHGEGCDTEEVALTLDALGAPHGKQRELTPAARREVAAVVGREPEPHTSEALVRR